MKKSLADRIEKYIKVLINRSQDKQIEIQRAEIAETFSCVPSQVTYVLSTRFTEKEGYFTESRRGGKGYVRITSIQMKQDQDYRQLEQRIIHFMHDKYRVHLLNKKEKELLTNLFITGLQRMEIPQKHIVIEDFLAILQEYLEA